METAQRSVRLPLERVRGCRVIQVEESILQEADRSCTVRHEVLPRAWVVDHVVPEPAR